MDQYLWSTLKENLNLSLVFDNGGHSDTEGGVDYRIAGLIFLLERIISRSRHVHLSERVPARSCSRASGHARRVGLTHLSSGCPRFIRFITVLRFARITC